MEKEEVNVKSRSNHKTLLNQITMKLSCITVEPVIFLSIFTSTIYQLIAQNLYLEKACRVNLQFNSSICDALASRNIYGFNKSQEATVQKIVTDMLALRTAILSFFPICLILFVGSWSDRHNKRKLFILAPISGEMLCCASLILNVLLFYELPLIVTVLGDSLPLALLGGWPCLFIGIYTYVGVRCDEKNRSLKMGFVSAAKMAGHSLGYSIAGILFQAVGFISFFCICILLQMAAFCLGILLVKEEKITRSENSNGVLKDFFDIKYVKNSFKICFNREPNNRRFKFIIIILLTVIVAGPSNGE
ncbi:hypothetical protein WA026_022682 [Henosepilachna vigintioctopunctata]|uniref:Adenylate cyclase n=1 Tax=Henosepilachna vigintioctopunctata TaxID=420089 RepID=A0AAW1U0F6_9CUCU